MKKFTTLLFSLFFLTNYAQVENRASLFYTYFAPAGGDNLNTINQSNVDFNYFLKSKIIAKKVRWDNSFAYKTLFFDGDISRNFHDLSYSSSFIYTKNLKNFIIGNVRLNYRSEMTRDLAIDALFPAVSAGYMRQSQTNKSLRWGLGVQYNNDFGKNVIIPFGIINYENQKMKFNATLPSSVLLLYKREKYNYGFNLLINPAIFQTHDLDDEKIKMLNVNLFAFTQFKLYDKLWLDVKPGVTLRRDLDFLDSGFNVLPVIGENRIDPHFVFSVGLLYRM
ncbi:MAG: DUF6268 family outer membrane beta-barrel protein [Flavobacterium sp.]